MHALNLSLFDVTNVLVAMFFWCKISTKKCETSELLGVPPPGPCKDSRAGPWGPSIMTLCSLCSLHSLWPFSFILTKIWPLNKTNWEPPGLISLYCHSGSTVLLLPPFLKKVLAPPQCYLSPPSISWKVWIQRQDIFNRWRGSGKEGARFYRGLQG